jgi:uncharacterized membrane protein
MGESQRDSILGCNSSMEILPILLLLGIVLGFLSIVCLVIGFLSVELQNSRVGYDNRVIAFARDDLPFWTVE